MEANVISAEKQSTLENMDMSNVTETLTPSVMILFVFGYKGNC